MSQIHEEGSPESAGGVVTSPNEFDGRHEWSDLESLVNWVRGHRVLLGAVLMVATVVLWKAVFLSHMFFRQDDFRDLDLAIQNRFTWSYLTNVEAGHLIIGPRAVAWVLARTTLYNWALASAVSLAFVAAAGLAGYRALRTLFGDQPRILIPLALYLVSPLTIPDLGWWSAALEAEPLQLAIFMALTAHVWHVRTGRTRHLLAALFWVAFGLAFFEKALVLPALLFAVTAAYLVPRRTFLGGAVRALFAFRKAWLGYLALIAGYSVILAFALRAGGTTPQRPGSVAGTFDFMRDLLRESFLPGALGGPWRWLPFSDGSYALAAPTTFMTWLSALVATAVIAATILRRRAAWRAWAILASWVFFADMVPVIIGRINVFAPFTLGTTTLYVADAMPVLAICIGLALWPVVDDPGDSQANRDAQQAAATSSAPQQIVPSNWVRNATATLIGLVMLGSVVSAQHYKSVVSGQPQRTYIADATAALRLAPHGINVLDYPVPANVAIGLFGKFAQASVVIGDLERGKLANKVHWITRPVGTIDGLYTFGPDGRLYPAWVYPTASVVRTKQQGCWPQRHGRVVVQFTAPSSIYTGILRVGYIWVSPYSTVITVRYGNQTRTLEIRPGINQAFVPVTGGLVSTVSFTGFGGSHICIGDVEAGNLEPSAIATPIPRVPQ
jgi:hypothetical protein